MHIFALQDLPESEDWIGRTSFQSQALNAYKPVASSQDEQGIGRNASNYSATPARYLVYQFNPHSESSLSEKRALEVQELATFPSELLANYVVMRSEYAAEAANEAGEISPKNPIYGEEEDVEVKAKTIDFSSSSRMLAYSGPLAGYSGAGFLSRGSGGLGVGGIGSALPGSASSRVTQLEEALEEAMDDIDQIQGGDSSGGVLSGGVAFEEETTAFEEGEVTYAPVLQVVSRIAVSVETVPGVGHLYFNAGPDQAPPGYTFVSEAFEGTHPGGEITAEIIAEEVLDTEGGTAPSVEEIGTTEWLTGQPGVPPVLPVVDPPVEGDPIE